MRVLTSLAAIAVLAGSAVLAQETYTKYGEAGGWNVFKINETGGCMIEHVEENGNVVQMGVGKAGNDFAFLAVFTTNPTDLAQGEKRDVVLDIDGDNFAAVAMGATDGVTTPGYQGGYLLFDNPDLIRDLAEGQMLTVIQDAGDFQIPLDGTKVAMEMGRECLGS